MWRVSCLLGWIALCSQTILCAPAPAHDIASGVFRAGAAKVDITPALGVSLDGPISKNGPTKAVHDPLHARALVLDDGATRLVIVVCDACVVGRDVFDAAKARIERAIQLPASHMLMAATHSHAAVRAVHIGRTPQDDAYHRVLAESITEAVFAACRNLAPARIAFTSFEKPDLVKCRRFVCKPATVSANPFGETDELIKSVAGTSTAILRPAGPTDPEVSIVAVQHADGTPLALLANYSVHYAGGQQRGVVSADYFGYFAEAIERQLGSAGRVPPYVAIMSNGTSGDTSAMASGGTQYERFELMQVAGREMARAVLAQIESVSYDHAIELAARESRVSFDVRQPDAARLAWAEEVLANPSSGALPHRMAKIYAQEAQHLAAGPAQVELILQSLHIGPLAIAAVPCEVFAETGLAIKQQSHRQHTFTISLANGYGGYLPPPEQHRLGGYETWPARSSFLEVEAEPSIRNELIRLINHEENSTEAPQIPDYAYDEADANVEALLWENQLFYDGDVALRGDEFWCAWLEFVPQLGDKIWIGRRAHGEWEFTRSLELPVGEYAAPTLTVDRSNDIWLTYEARSGDQWDLFATRLEEGDPAVRPQAVSENPASDILHRTCPGDSGIWCVWQTDRDGQFDICARQIGGEQHQPIEFVGESAAGDWHPAVASTTDGQVFVAWDGCRNGVYDVLLTTRQDGSWREPQVITASPNFAGRVDLAAADDGFVWISWEQGQPNWGQPFRGIDTTVVRDAVGPLHRSRTLHLAAIDAQGTLHRPTSPLPMPSVDSARRRANRPAGVAQLGAFYERARLTVDRLNRPWIAYRHYYTPWMGVTHRSHVENGWRVYTRCLLPEGWSTLYRFDTGQGDGMQRLEIAPHGAGIGAVWTTGRTDRNSNDRPRGIASASVEHHAKSRARFSLERIAPVEPAGDDLAAPQPPRPSRSIAGKSYHLFFGDLHRHTDFSLCRVPLDGTLDDTYRYATDIAQLDFLGITDHTRDIALGDPLSQLWWRSRKEVYRRQLVGNAGMRFMPFFAYERSHGNTADHNVISLRGDMLRPYTYPVPEFWKELDENTITIPHQPIRRDTWLYQDDALRPLVEIFQGCRDESIEDDVHEGLSRGYHLGFIASSDHMSTSASYAGVWAEAANRESVFRALQNRRTFGATTKIELAVWANDRHWMGQILPTDSESVKLTLAAQAPAAIRAVHLIVDGHPEKTVTPRDTQSEFSIQVDPQGKRFAYFHLQLVDGNEAWSSPIWFQ